MVASNRNPDSATIRVEIVGDDLAKIVSNTEKLIDLETRQNEILADKGITNSRRLVHL